MGEHTKLPWAATTRRGSWDWVIFPKYLSNVEICQMFHDGTEGNEQGEANATLIVRAVNSHAALVKAVNSLLEVIENAQSGYISGSGSDLEWDRQRDEAVSEARAALARLEEGAP